jgi:hypothetical protein
MPAVRAAFEGLIDYAGLYPPASLRLEAVAQNYATYRTSAEVWILGRLIVPAERLSELEGLARTAGASPEARWPVSVLVGGPPAIVRNREFIENARATADSVLAIESVEAGAATTDDVEALADAYPFDLERFIEIPSNPDPATLLAAVAAQGCAAKIRTGGVVPDAFPSPATVARFLTRAASAQVSMKATAGLHHAVRGEQRLTYAPDSASGTMHGFANLVFAATLLAGGKIDEELAEALLDDDRPEVFKFGGRAGSWLNAVVTYSEIAHARRTMLRSVGSCSFEEPVAELKALGWI